MIYMPFCDFTKLKNEMTLKPLPDDCDNHVARLDGLSWWLRKLEIRTGMEFSIPYTHAKEKIGYFRAFLVSITRLLSIRFT